MEHELKRNIRLNACFSITSIVCALSALLLARYVMRTYTYLRFKNNTRSGIEQMSARLVQQNWNISNHVNQSFEVNSFPMVKAPFVSPEHPRAVRIRFLRIREALQKCEDVYFQKLESKMKRRTFQKIESNTTQRLF